MVECPVCRTKFVANTVFCDECGLYLLESKEAGTDPLELEAFRTPLTFERAQPGQPDLPGTGPLSLRLRVGARSYSGNGSDRRREFEVLLVRPIRLGRIDPLKEVYPDIDLTADRALQHGVSRVHACVFRRGDFIAVEDLGSTNGTFLNGQRMAPYIPQRLKDGDQLRLGKLPVEVHFEYKSASRAGMRKQDPTVREPAA